MKQLLRYANIGIAFATAFAALGTILFNGNEDLMAGVGVGTFVVAFGVFFFLDNREHRARSRAERRNQS